MAGTCTPPPTSSADKANSLSLPAMFRERVYSNCEVDNVSCKY